MRHHRDVRRPGAGPRPAPGSKVEIRDSTAEDLPACARLGATLSRLHHRLDPARFFTVPDLEAGYAWWLAKERRNRKAVVLAAVRRRGGKEVVVGYAYGRIEPRDWNSLRETCGLGIDVIVEPRRRGGGLGTRLVEALAAALAARGAPRLVIEVAARNPKAQRAFAGMGFRPTVLEMARELPARAPRRRRTRTRT
jgi:RimJ/RimL family protein N-acetyltransferase